MCRRVVRAVGPVTLALVALNIAGCRGSMPDLAPVLQSEQDATQEWHIGPEVAIADTGPARFAGSLHEAFRLQRAMDTVAFVDRFYRAPGNEGYELVIDKVAATLREAGFDGGDERLRLEIVEEEGEELAWTPRSAELLMMEDGVEPRVLHSFAKPEEVDRVMLPINAPSCDVEGAVALSLDLLKKGMILVTDVKASQVMRRAQSRGAVAIVSASLSDFNEDPSGAERHLDAIQFRTLEGGNDMPVAQISQRSHLAIEEASQRAETRGQELRLRFRALVEFEERPVRTVIAVVEGATRGDEAVVMVSHVQEPGACDNASGVAGLLESVRSYVGLLRGEVLPWPAGSLVFVWGDEFRQSEAWLERTQKKTIAGISSDMTGQSAETGAIALLERMPDPGALFTLPPDAHTPWGAGEVEEASLSPNGLAIVARCAMVDVGLIEGGWNCADHPWEGGSDHDVFIAQDIPAVLFWHFTDFTYHTSLDRIEFVDPEEIRRTGVAILSTALAVADAQPIDLERYLQSMERERLTRVAAAREVDDGDLEALWDLWSKGARQWLRNLCLGIDEEIPKTEDH